MSKKELLDIVCFKWKPKPGYRSQFGPETPNVLLAQIDRHLSRPYRFTCITDDPTGLDGAIRYIPLWDDYANVPNPSSPQNPSCYRRLKMFSEEARDLIGERIVCMDLDTVITNSLDGLFDRPEDFVIWSGQAVDPLRPARVYNRYNGSLMMLRAGTRTQVWEKFDPRVSPRLANASGCRGSDQGWIAYCLGKNVPVWTRADGVYSFRVDIIPRRGLLPANACFVAFHGRHDPWDPNVRRQYPWIADHYWREVTSEAQAQGTTTEGGTVQGVRSGAGDAAEAVAQTA